MGSKETPQTPEDVVRAKIGELYEREANRRRAVDLAFEQVTSATGKEQQVALDNLERMLGMYGEFQEDLPGVFPSTENNG